MPSPLKNSCEKDTIPILIVFTTIGYYITGWYEKISCKTLLLNEDCYIMELLLYNHPRYVLEVMQMSLSTSC